MIVSLPPAGLGFIQNIGMTEWIIILVIMLLLFGRRLPEVGKSLGKGIVEFKKGLKGVEDEIETASNRPGGSAGGQTWQPQPSGTLPPSNPSQPPPAAPTIGQAEAAARGQTP